MEDYKTKIINNFRGENRWLSNFEKVNILYMDKVYPSSEHLYQACKATNEKDHEFVRNQTEPRYAKDAGDMIPIRPDWEDVKYTIMEHAVLCKFLQNKYLADKLLATAGYYLEEANKHGDKYWGTVDGEGENRLGLILMRVRMTLILDRS
jgi:ribA/ribD-fused uncharacterized protein